MAAHRISSIKKLLKVARIKKILYTEKENSNGYKSLP